MIAGPHPLPPPSRRSPSDREKHDARREAGVARIERTSERRSGVSTQVELLLIGQQLDFEPQESLLPLTAPMLASPLPQGVEQSVLVEQSLLPLTAPGAALSPQELEQSVLVEQSLLPLTAPMLLAPVAGQVASLVEQVFEQVPQQLFSEVPLTAPGLAVVSFEAVWQAPRAATRAAAANMRIVLMGVSLDSFVGDPDRERRVSTIRVARIGPPILDLVPDLLRFRERLGWGRQVEE